MAGGTTAILRAEGGGSISNFTGASIPGASEAEPSGTQALMLAALLSLATPPPLAEKVGIQKLRKALKTLDIHMVERIQKADEKWWCVNSAQMRSAYSRRRQAMLGWERMRAWNSTRRAIPSEAGPGKSFTFFHSCEESAGGHRLPDQAFSSMTSALFAAVLMLFCSATLGSATSHIV